MNAVVAEAESYAPIASLFAAEHAEWDNDLPMYQALAHRAGGPILDLACGTARVGLALATAGFEVHGIDASDALLKIAGDQSRQLEVQISLARGDMRRLSHSVEFGAVFCALDSFLHLTSTDDQLDALRSAIRVLKPGGLLALDVFNPTLDQLAARDSTLRLQGTFDDTDGKTVVHLVSWDVDPSSQQIDATHFYDSLRADGSLHRITTHMQMRYIHRFELELALRHVGFENIETFGSVELEPYDGLGDRLIAVATKPDTPPLAKASTDQV